MKLPQGPAAYGISTRPTIPQQKTTNTNTNPQQQQKSVPEDAARIALGQSIGGQTRVPGSAIPSSGSPIPTSKQTALNAYAKSSATNNPFSAAVASFAAKSEVSQAEPSPAATQGQQQPTSANYAPPSQPATAQTNSSQSVSAYSNFSYGADVVTAQPPPVQTTKLPRVSLLDDDEDEVVSVPKVDPQLEALAIRYVDNYVRQTGTVLSDEAKKQKIADVAKFYGAPSRSGRLEALVQTQDEVA